MRNQITAVKQHIQDHKTVYISVGGVVFAGITCVIMRDVVSQPISSIVNGTAGSIVNGTRNKVVMNNVSFISANRQGAPSWVIRCKETGNIFTSQRSAASAMEINESYISRHLNGLQEHANNYHFERICMAA